MREKQAEVWLPNKKRQAETILRKLESSRMTLEVLGERIAHLGIGNDFSTIVVNPENSMVPYLDGTSGHFFFEVAGEDVKLVLKPSFVIYDMLDSPDDDYYHKVIKEINGKTISPWVIEFSAGFEEISKKLATKIDYLLEHMDLGPKTPKRKLPRSKEGSASDIGSLIDAISHYKSYYESTTPDERFNNTKHEDLWGRFSSLVNDMDNDEEKELALQAMRAWEDGNYTQAIETLQLLY